MSAVVDELQVDFPDVPFPVITARVGFWRRLLSREMTSEVLIEQVAVRQVRLELRGDLAARRVRR